MRGSEAELARWHGPARRRCQHPSCRRRSRRYHRHHIVYEQKLVRTRGDCFAPENGFDICGDCHDEHHSHKRPIPLTALPSKAIEFAFGALGAHAYDYLKRRYAGEDPRLERELQRVESDAHGDD